MENPFNQSNKSLLLYKKHIGGLIKGNKDQPINNQNRFFFNFFIHFNSINFFNLIIFLLSKCITIHLKYYFQTQIVTLSISIAYHNFLVHFDHTPSHLLWILFDLRLFMHCYFNFTDYLPLLFMKAFCLLLFLYSSFPSLQASLSPHTI